LAAESAFDAFGSDPDAALATAEIAWEFLNTSEFLRLKAPVTIDSGFGDWRVCWLGGWTRQRLANFVMVVRIVESSPESRGAII
jgi:hypothetical protein